MDQGQFLFMKECLEEFTYPEIHTMNEFEVMDIFSKVNREFLVAWLLKGIDEKYDKIETKKDYASVIYCNGFCGKNESLKFINGDCEFNRQFTILYRMFKTLKSVSEAQKSGDTGVTLTIGDLESCTKFEKNLFPKYGPKRTLTATQRVAKISDCLKEIESLKNEIDSVSKMETQALDSSLSQQLITNLQFLEATYPDFKRKVLQIMMEREGTVPNKIAFNKDFVNKLQTCNKSLQSVLELVKSVTVVINFENKWENGFPDSNNNTMMRELADLCSQIASFKKKELFID